MYTYSFTPQRPGRHEIVVKLNDIELPPGSQHVLVYKKSNLKFEEKHRDVKRGAGNAGGGEGVEDTGYNSGGVGGVHSSASR